MVFGGWISKYKKDFWWVYFDILGESRNTVDTYVEKNTLSNLVFKPPIKKKATANKNNTMTHEEKVDNGAVL